MSDESGSSIFQELKRRNVFRVGLAYFVAAWLLTQISDTVFPRIGLPDSAVTLVIALLAIGLFPTLIFAWVFELTPQGIKREKDVQRDDSSVHQTARKLDLVIIGILAVAVAIYAYDKFGRQSDLVPTEVVFDGSPSIAVLPFENRSANSDDVFFVDGIHDDILTSIAKIGSMKVISRTSVE